MKLRTRRTIPAVAVAVTLSATGTLLLLGTGGATTTTRPSKRPAVSTCQAAPAPCGSDAIDEVVIHAEYQAAQQAINQGSHP